MFNHIHLSLPYFYFFYPFFRFILCYLKKMAAINDVERIDKVVDEIVDLQANFKNDIELK